MAGAADRRETRRSGRGDPPPTDEGLTLDDSAVQREGLPAAVAESLLRLLPEPVTVLDRDGVVVYSGGRDGELAGPDPLQPRPLFELVHPDHVLEAVDAFADARASAGHRSRIRGPVRAADGSHQASEVTLQNLGAAHGPPGPRPGAPSLPTATHPARA